MKPTLVILHGWGHSFDWSVLKQMLETDLPVVAFDLPGFGNEPLLDTNWTIPDYAQWVVSKIEKIDGDKIVLGHSFGGRITSYIASSNPKWLRGIVLSGAPCLYRPSFKIRTKILLAKIAKYLKIKKLFIKNNSDLKEADERGLGKIFRNVVSFDQTHTLPKITVPTLLIWGEYDSAVPLRIAREIQTLIPKSELRIIDQVGHNSCQENIYLFYGYVKNFIKNL